MPMPLLHLGATVVCMHAGQARPTMPFARVTVSGQPVVQTTSPHTIVGCSLVSQSGVFCATGHWLLGASRVMAGGLPIAIVGGTAVCGGTGTGMVAVASQTRVIAT